MRGASQKAHTTGQSAIAGSYPRRVPPCLTVLGSGDVIDYRLLGPLEVAVDGQVVDVGGLKQRALLTILLLQVNQPVHRDALIDRLWGERPPSGAEHAVDVYISRLRKALEKAAGTHEILTRPGGYLLQTAPEQLDVARFERLAEDGRRSLAAGDASCAAQQFGAALALAGARRSPTSSTSRSPRRKSRGWTDCEPRSSRIVSRQISRSGITRVSSANLRHW